jgi:D-cysteine desulfhydrase family pyridoxal phosphate-dependent enzyme
VTGTEVWLKRDDCTGLAFGGNKARKLEYLMASAREAGADTIVTFGGVQSNHTRCTAAAARRLGMDCHLILAGSPPSETTGNLLLDHLLGATLTFLCLTPSELTAPRVEAAFLDVEERLRSQRRRPFRIGPGGSTPVGALGYHRAMEEIISQSHQTGSRFTHVLVAFGTGGTLAGLVLGNILAGRPFDVIGISVAPPGMPASLGVPPVADLVDRAAALLDRRVDVRDEDVRVLYDYTGRAYGVPSPEGVEAIRSLARTEGVFLDPVYTGKAMAGLVDLCRRKVIGADERALFIHTGGTPALFAYSGALTR